MAYFGNEWHLRDAEATASVLDTDIYSGLSQREFLRRRRRAGKNAIWHVKHTSATEYALKNLGDLSGLVLLVAAVTASIFNVGSAAPAVCAILLFGIVLRVAAYIKSRNMLERISVEEIPSASVLRDGRVVSVRGDEIVCGDVVLLEAGDIAPCDGRIVSSGEIRVSERGITENRASVIKRDTVIMTDSSGTEIPCEYRVNMIFAGSAVLSGSCRIIATACGNDTLVSMRRGGILIGSGDNFKAAKHISELCRVGELAMIVLVMLLSVLSVVSGLLRGTSIGFTEAFIDAMALAAGSVFVYLPTIPYICVAIPMNKAMSGHGSRAVIKNADNIEKLSQVERVVLPDISTVKSGRASYTAYFAGDRLKRIGASGDSVSERLLGLVKSVVCTQSDVSLSEERNSIEPGECETLLKRISAGESCTHSEGDMYGTVVDRATTVDAHGERNNAVVFCNGSYIFRMCGDIRDVLSCCVSCAEDVGTSRITDLRKKKILESAEAIEERGGTVIAVAHRDSPYTTLKRLSTLAVNMSFDGFIALEEECESEIEEFAELFANGKLSLTLLSPRPYSDICYLAKTGLVKKDIPIVSFRDVLDKKELPCGSFAVSLPSRSGNRDKIDSAAKIRLATARALTQSLDGTALLTGEPSEAGMLVEDAVGFAVSRSSNKLIPQTLKRRADVSVYPECASRYGGFAGAMKAISAARCAVGNIHRSVCFALIIQCAAVVCTFLSAMLGISAMNAATVLLVGDIFTFAEILVISLSRFELSASECTESVPLGSGIVKAVLLGLLIGISCFIVCAASSALAHSMSGVLATLASSLLLSQFVLFSELLLEERLLKNSGEGNSAYVFCAMVLLATVLLFAFSKPFCTFFDTDLPSGISFTAGTLCAVLLLAVCECVKRIKNKK